HVPKYRWSSSIINQRYYFDCLAKELKFSRPEDWYQVKVSGLSRILSIKTLDIINEHNGSGILHMYKLSLANALQTIFPEYKWQVWRFHQAPKGFWDKDENIKEY